MERLGRRQSQLLPDTLAVVRNTGSDDIEPPFVDNAARLVAHLIVYHKDRVIFAEPERVALTSDRTEADLVDDHALALGQQPLILTVPGLGNSGPGHWQTLWEQQRSDCRRVHLGQWDQPHRNSWVNQLNLAIRASARPVVLVAHSLGCLAVAWWASLEAAEARILVTGALLVAPPDVANRTCDARLAGFAPAPAAPLPFPSIVVASRNDPYLTRGAARRLARRWHASFADAGAIGHINADSGIAEWPFGQFLLARLLARVAPIAGYSRVEQSSDASLAAIPHHSPHPSA